MPMNPLCKWCIVYDASVDETVPQINKRLLTALEQLIQHDERFFGTVSIAHIKAMLVAKESGSTLFDQRLADLSD
jgi:hypothetical protein